MALDMEEVKKRRTHVNQYTSVLPDCPYSIRFATAQVLHEQGKSANEIIARTALNPGTIARIRKGEQSPFPHIVKKLRALEVDKLTFLHHRIIDGIVDSDIQKASLLQKVTAASILVDKRELLDGKPTSRSAFSVEADSELQRKREEIQRQIDAVNTEITSIQPVTSETVDTQKV